MFQIVPSLQYRYFYSYLETPHYIKTHVFLSHMIQSKPYRVTIRYGISHCILLSSGIGGLSY